MLIYRGSGKTAVIETDLKMFDVDEKESARRAQANRERAKRFEDPNSGASKRGNWFFWILFAMCVLAAFYIYLSPKIDLNRIDNQTIAAANRLDEAMRENARLQASLEAMATPAKVEEYAAANGLFREQVSQITHITVNVEKIIEVAQPKNKTALGLINDWIGGALEFLGF